MKQTLTCLLVDDQEPQLDILHTLIAKIPHLQIVYATTQPLAARDFLLAQSVDIVFSDVDMPRLTGLELAGICQGRAHFILCTSHKDYAAESYEYDVADYLLKPVSLPRLMKALEKVEIRRSLQAQEAMAVEEASGQAAETILPVDSKEIVYVEVDSNYVYYYTTEKKELIRSTLTQVEETLAAQGFVRIHRSYLVSLDKVISVDPGYVWVVGLHGRKLALPLGPRYRKSFLEALEKWKNT